MVSQVSAVDSMLSGFLLPAAQRLLVTSEMAGRSQLSFKCMLSLSSIAPALKCYLIKCYLCAQRGFSAESHFLLYPPSGQMKQPRMANLQYLACLLTSVVLRTGRWTMRMQWTLALLCECQHGTSWTLDLAAASHSATAGMLCRRAWRSFQFLESFVILVKSMACNVLKVQEGIQVFCSFASIALFHIHPGA